MAVITVLELQEVDREGVCLFVDGANTVTVVNDQTGLDIQFVLAQHIKVLSRLCRSNALLYLNRINVSGINIDKINLFLINIAVVEKKLFRILELVLLSQ